MASITVPFPGRPSTGGLRSEPTDPSDPAGPPPQLSANPSIYFKFTGFKNPVNSRPPARSAGPPVLWEAWTLLLNNTHHVTQGHLGPPREHLCGPAPEGEGTCPNPPSQSVADAALVSGLSPTLRARSPLIPRAPNPPALGSAGHSHHLGCPCLLLQPLESAEQD